MSERRPNYITHANARVAAASSRIRYMPTLTTIVTRSEAQRLRSAEQQRILNDPNLKHLYREWHLGGGLVHVNARIHPHARVLLNAIVDENAFIGARAIIGGHAEVDGRVIGNAQVRDEARVDNGATIKGNATVEGRAQIGETCVISGYVRIGGDWVMTEHCYISGHVHFSECKSKIGDKKLPNLELHDTDLELGSIVICDKRQIAAIHRLYNLQPR